MTVRVRKEWLGDKFTAIVNEAVTRAGLPKAAAIIEGQMKDNLAGPGPSKPGSPPGQMTGLLKQSIGFEVNGSTARIGTPFDYGRYLEYGAFVRPKKAKAIPIPLNDRAKRLMRRGLVVNKETGQITRGGLRDTGIKFEVIPRAGRPSLLAELTKTGKQKRQSAVFLLVPYTRIAPRPWALRSLRETQDRAFAAFVASTARAIKKMTREASK